MENEYVPDVCQVVLIEGSLCPCAFVGNLLRFPEFTAFSRSFFNNALMADTYDMSLCFLERSCPRINLNEFQAPSAVSSSGRITS